MLVYLLLVCSMNIGFSCGRQYVILYEDLAGAVLMTDDGGSGSSGIGSAVAYWLCGRPGSFQALGPQAASFSNPKAKPVNSRTPEAEIEASPHKSDPKEVSTQFLLPGFRFHELWLPWASTFRAARSWFKTSGPAVTANPRPLTLQALPQFWGSDCFSGSAVHQASSETHTPWRRQWTEES